MNSAVYGNQAECVLEFLEFKIQHDLPWPVVFDYLIICSDFMGDSSII